MARDGISSYFKFDKIAELPGAAAPGPHHFARIMDRGVLFRFQIEKIAELPGASAPGTHHFVKILDRGLKARTPNLNKSLRFQGLPFLDPISLLGYWICS